MGRRHYAQVSVDRRSWRSVGAYPDRDEALAAAERAAREMNAELAVPVWYRARLDQFDRRAVSEDRRRAADERAARLRLPPRPRLGRTPADDPDPSWEDAVRAIEDG